MDFMVFEAPIKILSLKILFIAIAHMCICECLQLGNISNDDHSTGAIIGSIVCAVVIAIMIVAEY